MVIAINEGELYTTRLLSGNHELIADEAEEVGGKDVGPSPGLFLQMALASCTAVTLRMYATRKQMALKKIRVEVGTEKVGDKTLFLRDIYLDGDMDQSQRDRLLQIANACPVHKILTHPIEISTALKE
jgi:putative redox protein